MKQDEIKKIYIECIVNLVCTTSMQYLSYKEIKKIEKKSKLIVDELIDELNFGY